MIAILSWANGIDVRSVTNCPSSQAILAKLLPLLPGDGGGEDVAWVEDATPGQDGTTELRVRLIRSDASVVADRRLALQGGCDEMADTVATVLAAWETPSAPPVARLAAEKPGTQPAGTKDASTAGIQLWLGAAGGAGLVGGIAATGSLELLAGRVGSHGQARGAVIAQTSRQRNLDVGKVIWRRTLASLGLGWQSPGAASGSSWQGSADAGVLLGWLTASGGGFAPDSRQDTFEYGVGAGLRAGRKFGAWALWLECRTNFWAEQQRAVLSDSPSNAVLPRLDILVTLGASGLVLR